MSSSTGEGNGLEIGMSGMSLVSGFAEGISRSSRKETDSTVASSPQDDREEIGYHFGSSKELLPGSPMSDKNFSNAKTYGKPPGMGGTLPSPIGKPGHSKNSSASSPLLTLTPNSSVDGPTDWSKHASSPFHEGAPHMPFLNPEQKRIPMDSNGIDVFDFEGNDGLLGLEALRERAYSSPGPFEAGRSQGHANAPGNFEERARNRSDRPPLSQAYDGGSYHSGDRSVGERSAGSMGMPMNSSIREYNNVSADSSIDSKGFGAIGRPELRPTAVDFDVSRRRAASQDNFQDQFQSYPQGMYDQTFAHKFGTLPSLGAHVQQQRAPHGPQAFMEFPKPRHVRSVSTPAPPIYGAAPGMAADGRVYPGALQHPNSFGFDNTFKQNGAMRSGSFSHGALSTSYDGASSAMRMSTTLMPPYGPAFNNYPPLQRRDALDFVAQQEYHSFSPSNSVTPGQSPHQGSYIVQGSVGSFSKSIPSDASFHSRQHSGHEDDLTHPLVGEHIEVPGDHVGEEMGTGRPFMPASMVRASSLSIEQGSPQFLEVHHLPTAGAAVPVPKVTYIVKFKRTQRNFVLGPRINRDLKIGTYVKVEADRGEDLGIVVGKASSDKFNVGARNSLNLGPPPPGSSGPSPVTDLKRIIRLATHDEVSLLNVKRDEEEELLKICRSKVRQRGLPMNVVDAEYQFDRHKLTFFFEAEGRVDFRDLVRDLFSMYKTRIWMQQLDKNTSSATPAMLAPQASDLQMDFGTPIIAPVSEFADSVVVSGISGNDTRSH